MRAVAPSLRWLGLGALGWTIVAAVYITATGFRRLAAGADFFSPAQVGQVVLMFVVGALLSVALFPLFGRIRAGSREVWVLVLRYALIGAGYLLVWATILVGLRVLGIMQGPPPVSLMRLWLETVVMMAFISLGLYAVMVMAFEAVRHVDRVRERVAEAARLQSDLAEARTTELRSRLNPDLIHGTFEMVSRMMDEDVRAARSVLADLGELIRVSLGRNGESEITLRDEVDLLRRYVDIERHRRPGLAVRCAAEEEAMSARVPALILQPVVESLLTGGAPGRHPETIRIEAWCTPERLHLAVAASGMGADARLPADGDGITRARARIALTRGEGATLRVMREPDGPAVHLTIPRMDGKAGHG